jgi:hypothetical protein
LTRFGPPCDVGHEAGHQKQLDEDLEPLDAFGEGVVDDDAVEVFGDAGEAVGRPQDELWDVRVVARGRSLSLLPGFARNFYLLFMLIPGSGR